MQYPVACLVLLGAVASLSAAEKKLPIEQTSNELIDISATALLEKDKIRQELGTDLGADIVVVRVTVRPVSDKPIQLSLDDFLLVSSKDGQRAEPYAPSQIAGSAAIVVTPTGTRNGGLGSNPRRPTFGGGIGGIGSSGGGVGNAGGGAETGDAKVESTSSDKANPLLAVLNDKVLPEKEIKDPVSGLLYFQMVGKIKPKDLELHYKGPAGRLALRFHP
jgi:hypothetical protein